MIHKIYEPFIKDDPNITVTIVIGIRAKKVIAINPIILIFVNVATKATISLGSAGISKYPNIRILVFVLCFNSLEFLILSGSTNNAKNE